MPDQPLMQLGVIFPQTEIGNDPAVIRAYAAAVEAAGYAHLGVYDHVLGADPDRAAPLGGFEALGEDFGTRGRRVEEQIEVLRRLWSQDLVTFHGRFHHVTGAGINPRPRRGSIPVWIGGSAEAALRRAARLADGFVLNVPARSAAAPIDLVRRLLVEAGRDPSTFGIAGRVTLRDEPEDTLARVREWEELGATHVSVNSMGTGLAPEEHAERLVDLSRAWGRDQPAAASV